MTQLKHSESKYYIYIHALFWVTLIFSATGLKLIWRMEDLSRIVNLAILFSVTYYAISSLFTKKLPAKVWYFFALPSTVVVAGIIINIIINALLNGRITESITYAIPWLTYLAVIHLAIKGRVDPVPLWNNFYNFLLFANIASTAEYIFVFLGMYSPTLVETPYGNFLVGHFSFFFPLADGTPHYRYYACFTEPGSLAMVLLPAILYAMLRKKYVGLIIFLIALYLTDSLGGYIGLLLMIITLPFLNSVQGKRKLLIAVPLSILIAAAVLTTFTDEIMEKYVAKGDSAAVREKGLSDTISAIPTFALEHPFGLELHDTTSQMENNTNYLGFSFTPAIYLQTGGVLAFLGYIISLTALTVVSLILIIRNELTLEEKLVPLSFLVLLPFIFQRTTFLESPLFSLLFLPTLIKALIPISTPAAAAAHRK